MAKYTIHTGNNNFNVEIMSSNRLRVDGNEFPIELIAKKNIFQLTIGNNIYNLLYKKTSETECEIWLNDQVLKVTVENAKSKLLKRYQTLKPRIHSTYTVKAPMPGLVTKIEVSAGDEVHVGTGLIVLEAMKMENEIRSLVDGKIKSIEIQNRTIVDKDQILMTIEPSKK